MARLLRSSCRLASLRVCHFAGSMHSKNKAIQPAQGDILHQLSSECSMYSITRLSGGTSWQSTALPLTELAGTSSQGLMIALSRYVRACWVTSCHVFIPVNPHCEMAHVHAISHAISNKSLVHPVLTPATVEKTSSAYLTTMIPWPLCSDLRLLLCVMHAVVAVCLTTHFILQIWSTQTALLLRSCRGHDGEVTDLAINIENSMIASSSNDTTIRCWSLEVCTTGCNQLCGDACHAEHANQCWMCWFPVTAWLQL